ncbi:MerR family transcriptional regulator [Zobellia galactanivorans]|uniref:MerR family transcriptional regulator n=1 Tax=Zobellia TaxID=112040 RepID=UPI000B52FF7A|nr:MULTISPECIES: MerR family transcriptional regulator [Zobellia]MDO6810530.1 MerR family transcriptional regulator [Zobellia galactanivorans]OWW25299.1 MerR family transcriptional regulator [Zobellia sp. OII3]
MNNIKKSFSIRDLENLSGIKAHTIRIWEKRYNLLSPERTDTNIRRYSLESLQKLLNITLLYNNGYKISKIAHFEEGKIPQLVTDITSKSHTEDYIANTFKMAMINFDQALFTQTYNSLLEKYTFSEIFRETFVPLLNELGILWQTDTISPAHEHFVANLIKQKIILKTEEMAGVQSVTKTPVIVPYLPENEIHEIGLLFLNYEIVSKGYKSIYLGQTVPLKNLQELMKTFEDAHFISYFTVSPTKDKIEEYVAEFASLASDYPQAKLWLLGYQTQYLDPHKLPSCIKLFSSIDKVIEQL